MKEYLISIGYKMYSNCSCSGMYSEKYKKTVTRGISIVEIRPIKNWWSLKINGVFQVKGNSDNLQSKLTEYEVI